MSATTHRYPVATFPTDAGAWLASARIAANGGPVDTEVRQAVEVCGETRRPVWVVCTTTEDAARVAAELLELFA